MSQLLGVTLSTMARGAASAVMALAHRWGSMVSRFGAFVAGALVTGATTPSMGDKFYRVIVYTVAALLGVGVVWAVIYAETAYIDAQVRRCIVEILDDWEHSGRIP